MMRTICLSLLLANAAAVHMLRDVPDGMTLRKWMQAQPCLNLASLPLVNTMFAQLGALDALNDAGLMKKVTGMSGVSSGALATAIAASKNQSEASRIFRSTYPGLGNLGARSDPELSQFFRKKILDPVLAKNFEDLKIPLAVTAVHYHTEKAAADVDSKAADPVVISDGDLPEAVILSSSAMVGPGCPRCLAGFQAKKFRDLWPVADGFLKDEYGTMGLHALDKCDNLLHVMPQNYPQQLQPTLNMNLDTEPKNVVSLGVDVPSSGIMSMVWDSLKNTKAGNLLTKVNPTVEIAAEKFGGNPDEAWEKLQYETAYAHMTEQLDQPMMVGEEPNHFFVDLNLMEHWKEFRGPLEKELDRKQDAAHAKYWVRTIGRRNEMVAYRNKRIADGKLSFKIGGNGKGAPEPFVPTLEHKGPRAFSTHGPIW